MATAATIQLNDQNLGHFHATPSNDAALQAASEFLQKNHDDHHMFWREVAGHNHVTHSVLNVFALGGGPEDLRRAFDDGAEIQRPIPYRDPDIVRSLEDPKKFREHMGDLDQYPNFLAFFSQKISEKGWVEVVKEHVFGKSANAETMFANLFEGLYHPLIHLGLGVEFVQPPIVAEGLAQAASHDSMGVEAYLRLAEAEAAKSTQKRKSMLELLQAVHELDVVRAALDPHVDAPTRVREGVLRPGNLELMADLAAQFRVTPEDLARRLAETTNTSAFTVGAAQRPGKARKIDFFYMHAMTGSIALSVLSEQPWISVEDKVRLVEFKGRLDLVWYAASGAVDVRLEDITEYKAERSAGMGWDALFRAVLKVHDDGHLAKLTRALRHGAESQNLVDTSGPEFLVRGDSWFKIAQMAYDSTVDRDIMDKWIWGVGFDEYWANVPDL